MELPSGLLEHAQPSHPKAVELSPKLPGFLPRLVQSGVCIKNARRAARLLVALNRFSSVRRVRSLTPAAFQSGIPGDVRVIPDRHFALYYLPDGCHRYSPV
ncbi:MULTISPECIES: hypothetical protein [Burkholderia]|uniref:hypothetical protein n=1 Tax=Burkholderia TaxID=32008 RepID=UPI000A6B2374|nr:MULTISPECIES: hypothetical protein [Burkholderia]